MPEYTHVSPREDLSYINPVEQLSEPDDKPKGLWYEVDGDWRRWCNDEHTTFCDDGYLYRLTFGNENILRIQTTHELDAFSEKYGNTDYHEYGGRRWSHTYRVRWAEITQEYDGIEIAPYNWSRRLELGWYYTWDCASGCIWQPRGATLELVGKLKEVGVA